MSSLIEIGQVVLIKRNRLWKIFSVFSLYFYYLPLKQGATLWSLSFMYINQIIRSLFTFSIFIPFIFLLSKLKLFQFLFQKVNTTLYYILFTTLVISTEKVYVLINLRSSLNPFEYQQEKETERGMDRDEHTKTERQKDWIYNG